MTDFIEVPENIVQSLILDYTENFLSPNKLSKKYNYSPYIIRKVLKERGHHRTSYEWKRIHSPLNVKVFSDITREDSQYFFGLLLSDGCLTRNSVQLTLHNQDVFCLNKYCEFLGLDKTRIRKDNKWECSTVTFRDKIVIEKLRKIGLYERKSLILECPEDFRESRHFWRGMIDGDGHVGGLTTKRNTGVNLTFELSGTKSICDSFAEFCKNNSNSDYFSYNLRENGNIWCISLGRQTAKEISKLLYSDCEFFIKRKKDFVEKYWYSYEPNALGRAVTVRSKTGVNGVHYVSKSNRYRVTILSKYVGEYKTLEEAISVRKEHEQKVLEERRKNKE